MKKLLFILIGTLPLACIKPNPCGEHDSVGYFTNVYYGKAYVKPENYTYKDSVETPATFVSDKGDRYVYPKAGWNNTLKHIYAQSAFEKQDD